MSNKAMVIDRADLHLHPWYYTIELEPGVFSAGQKFPNVALTRALLGRTSLAGQRCLDIGTMEGLIPILMTRRNAAKVVAYDRPSAYRERVNMVKAIYGANYEFVSGFEMTELRDRVDAPFDVVTFSGVLYHMFSPLTGLAIVRGLVRDGGIVIIETAAALRPEQAMYFNSADRFGGHSYFAPSLACLDYMIRFLRMSVIDCEFILSHQVDGIYICRVALACRAELKAIGDPADAFLHGGYHNDMDLAEYVEWNRLKSGAARVPYRTPSTRPLDKPFASPSQTMRRFMRLAKRLNITVSLDAGQREHSHWLHPDCKSLDVYKVAAQSKPFVPGADASKLRLDDT